MRYLKFTLEDGLHVIARGRLGVYEPKGEYQLLCEHMQPHGLGALQLAFEQLKKKLQAEGLFDQARKRPLPALPRKIGIVTSLDGAALHDIIKVLRRRHPNAHLVIRPARVQGETAAAEITRGLRAIGRVAGVDVVILARGGGSTEDLWAFNEEVVARGDRREPGSGHLRGRARSRLHDRRFRRRPPRADALRGRRARGRGQGGILQPDRSADAPARSGGAARSVERRRAAVHALSNRRGLAGWPARVGMRGRHAAELTFRLRRAADDAAAAARARVHQALRPPPRSA